MKDRTLSILVFLLVLGVVIGTLAYTLTRRRSMAASPTTTHEKSAGGIWTDSKTGLTWQVKPKGDAMKWNEAKAYCTSLFLGSHRDWRLPTISELRSLIRGCKKTETGGLCAVTDRCLKLKGCWNDSCAGCESKKGPGLDGRYWPAELVGENSLDWYWSSSNVADYGRNVWHVDFGSGNVDYGDGYDDGYSVHCVR